MGNSGHSGHHTSQSVHRRRHSSCLTNSSRVIDRNVEDFFNSKGIKDKEVRLGQIRHYFPKSFIVKRILVESSKEKRADEEETSDDEDKLRIDLLKIKETFSELIECFSNSAIVELYTNLIFDPIDPIEYEFVEMIFRDALTYCLKSIGFHKIDLSSYADKTIKAMVRSIQSVEKNMTNQTEIKDWIMNNFPLLFTGFHNWFTDRLREKRHTSRMKPKDLSNFMNLTTTWFLISNLPSCYTKELASENGTIFEKLRNCLTEKRWKTLYQSENHGLSLNRFQANLFNYKAGTIVFIYCNTDALYCVCSNQEYRESPTPYGDESTRIYRFWDDFKHCEITSTGSIYLNTKSRFLKLGLIFGYSNQVKPVLKINEEFHGVEHELSMNDEIIGVEAWGCGPSKASLDQQNMKNWESKQIEKMRTVKRDSGWGEDKAILDLAGVKTEHSERGDM